MDGSKVIRIIGAGPAGLTAAINLAKNDYKVIVYEKNADVGMRFHDDFQGLENWSMEEDVLTSLETMSIKASFFYRPIHKGLLYGPSSKVQIESSKPLFYLIRRGKSHDTLDYSLKEQALSLGVKIMFNTCAGEKDGEIIAIGPKKVCGIAIGMNFETDLEDSATVIFDDTVAPKGYAYLLVAERKATLASVLYKNFDEANQFLGKSLERFKSILSFKIKNPTKFGGYGSFSIPRSAMQGGRMYVGESSGFQDFLFGFGIKYAIVSGYLSAKSIIEKVDYDTLWKKHFLQQLQASLSNRILYELLGPMQYDFLVKKTGSSKDPRKFWMRLYHNSIYKKFIYPFALLRYKLRDFKSRPVKHWSLLDKT